MSQRRLIRRSYQTTSLEWKSKLYPGPYHGRPENPFIFKWGELKLSLRESHFSVPKAVDEGGKVERVECTALMLVEPPKVALIVIEEVLPELKAPKGEGSPKKQVDFTKE